MLCYVVGSCPAGAQEHCNIKCLLRKERREEFTPSGHTGPSGRLHLYGALRGKYPYGAHIPSYGPAYPYKGGSGPVGSGEKVRPHPHTVHVISGQSASGTACYRLVRSMQLSQSRKKPYSSYHGYTYRQGK